MEYEQQLKAMARTLVGATMPEATEAEVAQVAIDLLKLIPRCVRFHRGGRWGWMTTNWEDGLIIKNWDRRHTEMDDAQPPTFYPSSRSALKIKPETSSD